MPGHKIANHSYLQLEVVVASYRCHFMPGHKMGRPDTDTASRRTPHKFSYVRYGL